MIPLASVYRQSGWAVTCGNLRELVELATALDAAPRFPYQTRESLVEIPITTARAFRRNLPAGGGGYFRFAPYALLRWAIRSVNVGERRPAIFYLHPWEIDPGRPQVRAAGLKTRFRHYLNLSRTEARLKRLMTDFRWDRVDRAFRASLA